MAGRKFRLLTKNISEDDGLIVNLRKVDSKVIAPRPKFVPKLDGEVLEVQVERAWKKTWHKPDGTDVTDRKKEFEWMKVDQKGELVAVSTAPTTTINVVKEVPLNLLIKNLIPENLYLLYAWKGSKDEAAKYYNDRVRKLREEAERYSENGLAGLASFTWGNQFEADPKSFR